MTATPNVAAALSANRGGRGRRSRRDSVTEGIYEITSGPVPMRREISDCNETRNLLFRVGVRPLIAVIAGQNVTERWKWASVPTSPTHSWIRSPPTSDHGALKGAPAPRPHLLPMWVAPPHEDVMMRPVSSGRSHPHPHGSFLLRSTDNRPAVRQAGIGPKTDPRSAIAPSEAPDLGRAIPRPSP